MIKHLLKERGVTIQELSDKLGVDRNNLYNSLTKGNPTLQQLELVSSALGVPVSRLFTVEQNQRFTAQLYMRAIICH